MKIKRNIIGLMILGFVFSLMISNSAFCLNRKNPIDSKEYKLLLKPSIFSNPKAGSRIFWKLVKQVVLSNGIKITDAEKVYKKREIAFFDTNTNSLYNKSFITRVRARRIDRTRDGLKSKKGTELTLKFRNPELTSSIVAPVKPGQQYDSKVSLEQDVSYKSGKMSSVFSRSGKIYTLGALPKTISELTRFFPLFGSVGLNEKLGLNLVGKTIVVEKRIRPGYMYLAGKKIKTLFSFWYKNGETKPFVAEFSYRIRFSRNRKKIIRNDEMQKQADQIFLELAKRSKAFLSPKQTKTGQVYELK